MPENPYIQYEKEVYSSLSRTLKFKGWSLKTNVRYNKNIYDIGLFCDDILLTFIEIKRFDNKSSSKKIIFSGELTVRKLLNDRFNYGFLFLNGKLFLVDKMNSNEIFDFPEPKDFNWLKTFKNSFSQPITPTNLKLSTKRIESQYSEKYDYHSVSIIGMLLRCMKLLNEKDKQIRILQNENKNLHHDLLDFIKVIRNSNCDEDLKIDLINRNSSSYFKSMEGGKNYFNKYINSWCDNWNILEMNSKIFIRESENLYNHISEDYTAFIHGLTKALENEILYKLFHNFLFHYKKNKIDLNYRIEDSENKGTIVVFKKFLKSERMDNFLSLDKMRFIISALFSETNDKLLIKYRTVYLEYFHKIDNIFENHGSINKIKEIRNEGAHVKPILKIKADYFKKIFVRTFNELINNYKL